MKLRNLFAVLAVLAMSSSASAGIVLNASAPGTNVLSSDAGGINSNLFTFTGNANNVRGQLFNLGANTAGGTQFQIDSITIQKNNTTGEAAGSPGGSITYVDSALNLWLFQGTSADWTAGSGRTSDVNPLTGTSTTQLYTEAFDMTGLTIDDDEFVTLEFATPIIVNQNTDFGFALDYDQNASAPDRFGYSESGNGGRISADADSHDVSSRGVHYYVQGTAITAVPEPSSLVILTLVGAGIVARRRRS